MLSTILSTAAIVATASAAFDPLSKNNVITYWGQGANQARLVETCKNSAYDIINVGFVNTFPDQGEGGWPGTNFGNACWGDVYQNEKGENTTLLKTCPYIGEDVIACQQTYGKKIFLSLGGGSRQDYYIDSVQSARNFANFLWAAFGPVSASTAAVPRPWGDAGVDGFDFDIESYVNPPPTGKPNYQKAFYSDMIKRFKSGLFPTDTSKEYYISGAPQCTIPDAHFTDVVANSWFDFLFIQFYNNDGCSARDGIKAINGKAATDISYLEWVATKSLNPNIRMSIGLPAAKKASRLASYFLTPTEAQKLVKKFYKNKLFGGVMLWEATFATKTAPCGTDYGMWMKNILNGQAKGKDIATACSKKRDLSEHEEQESDDYEEAPASTSSSCTSTMTLTRSQSTVPVSSAPAYGQTDSASSPSAPATTSAPGYSVSEAYVASSNSVPAGELCTKTSTLIFRSGSETSTYVEPCASSCTAKTSSSAASVPASTSSATASSPVQSYPASSAESSPAASSPASPEGSSPAASSPASPEGSSPAPSYPSSSNCGEVTVTVKQTSTVYVTPGAPTEDTTTYITTQSTSTIYSTTTVYPTGSSGVSAPSGGAGYEAPSGSASAPAYSAMSSAPGSASAPAYSAISSGPDSASAPGYPETSSAGSAVYGSPSYSASAPPYPKTSSASGYENSPVGEEGSPFSAPAAPAYPSHGHHHGQSYSHSHSQSQQSTTTVTNVVTVVPVPMTSAEAVQPTGAPYPYGPAVMNGTASGTASASAPAWTSYAGPQQQVGNGAGIVSVSGLLTAGVAVLVGGVLL